MDPTPTPLAGLVRELAASERFAAFVDAFPANARVSEPALPLLLTALHATLDRALVCVLAEDEDARDAAEAVGWFVDPATRCAPAEPRRPGRVGARVPGTSRRRASTRPGRPARRRPRLRLRPCARRRHAAVRGSDGGHPADARRPTRSRHARRGAGTRRVRARGARRRPRSDRGSRRPRRHLPEHRARATSSGVLRRRHRAHPRVLAVHAAHAPFGR